MPDRPDKTDSSNTVAISIALLALIALLLGVGRYYTSTVEQTANQPSTTQQSTQPSG
jgi:hypothetical protein